MDENNIFSPEENTTKPSTENTSKPDTQPTVETTADAYERLNDAATKPASAFEMPSGNKSTAASTYYSAPDPTPASELEANQQTEPESKPDTAISYAPDPVYSSAAENIYSTKPETTESVSMGFAITSLVLGILSILSSCCCVGFIFAIPGIIFGCLQKKNEYDKKPGMAIAGIVTSILGIIFYIAWTILAYALRESGALPSTYGNYY